MKRGAQRLASFVGSLFVAIAANRSKGQSYQPCFVLWNVCTLHVEVLSLPTSELTEGESREQRIYTKEESMERRKIESDASQYSSAISIPANYAASEAGIFKRITSNLLEFTQHFVSILIMGVLSACRVIAKHQLMDGVATGSKYADNKPTIIRFAQEVLPLTTDVP